jgi:hypothetical protein
MKTKSPSLQAIPPDQVLQKNPQIKRGEDGYDWRELDMYLAKLRAMLGTPIITPEEKSPIAFNIIKALDSGYNPAVGTGSATAAAGTVDVMINGVVYHLLRADQS